MLVRSAGDRVNPGHYHPPNPCPSLRSSLSYLPVPSVPLFCRAIYVPRSFSLCSTPRLTRPRPTFLQGKASPGRGYSVPSVSHARTHTRAPQRRVPLKFMCRYTRSRTREAAGCTCRVGVRLWSTVGLCKSVRYLDTCKGVRKGARTPSLIQRHPHPTIVFSPLTLVAYTP